MRAINNPSLTLAACLFSFVFVGHGYAQTLGQQLSPKQLFPSSVLNIYSPDSGGWVLSGVARNGVSFAKGGIGANETYGAQAILFELKAVDSKDKFISFVKNRIATMNPSPRFEEIQAEYQYTENRGYPCVSARSTFNDNAAVTSAGKEQLKLQVIALYCRHPETDDVGFFAAYSHRGESVDDQLEAPASNFIEGVDVPKK